MICTGCGLEINERSETCYKCGTITGTSGGTRPCPMCGEQILAAAKKCRFCNEWLDPSAAPKAPAPERDIALAMVVPIGISPLAIAAGYFGLIAVCGLPAPFALLLGVLAVRDIKRNPEKHGMGRAVFGIVMGLLGCVFMAVGIFMQLMQR